MTNKALTILIADEQHLHRLYIEKMLNQLGYHRIVPVQTFEEAQLLTALPAQRFDVLIINAGLAVHTCGPQPRARHVLIYDHLNLNPDLDLSTPADVTRAVLVRLPGVPDSVNLEHFMDIIDPPAATTGLRVLPWLRELSRTPVAGA